MYSKFFIIFCFTCVFLTCVNHCTGCTRRRCTRRSPPRDTTPPTLICPGNINRDTDPGLPYSTRIHWTTPTAWDNTDGNVRVQLQGGRWSGEIFHHGVHSLGYSAKDNSGNTASCNFKVTVIAKYCSSWSTMQNGWISCGQFAGLFVGTVCKFGCRHGYILRGSDTATCQAENQWSILNQSECIPVDCGRLMPGNMYTSIHCTDGYHFSSKCHYSCTNGFGVLPGHSRVRSCDANGKWFGQEPVCRDVTPPQYTNCPSILVFYADKSTDVAKVYWQNPVHSDNAGLGSTSARLVQGPSSGSMARVGEYMVVYQAWDSENNTATCEIKLTVKQITCSNLYPRPHTTVVCPNGVNYGSKCIFACREGAVLKGPEEVHCEAFGSNNVMYGRWTFGSSQPFCELEERCIRPSPPQHGALSCDTWAGGAYCVLMCQQGYVVQDVGFNPMLTCSDTKGEFSGLKEDGKLPKCTEWDADNSFFNYELEEYYYFDGECWTAKEQIKENFITALLASLGNVCSATNCSLSSVEVDCFNETIHAKERRSVPSTMSVSVVLTVSTDGKNKLSPAEAIMMRERIYQTRAESNASLDMGGGLTLKLTSIQVSNPNVICPLGSYADRFTLSCVLCSKGTYHDEGGNACKSCPRGQYQPTSGQIACLECPVGTSTPEFASVDANHCVVACQPGYVSETGTIPCSPCDMGSYSTGYGQTLCTPCTGSKTTRANQAATSPEDCYDFDLEFASDIYSYGNASVMFTSTSNCTSLYLALWIKCSKCDRILEISDVYENTVLSIETSKGFIDVSLSGCNVSFPVLGLFDYPRWRHLALQIKDKTISIFVDGDTEILPSQVCAFETILTLEGYKLLIGENMFIGSVTSLNLWNVSVIDLEMPTVQRCINDQRGNMVAWRQFQKLEGPFLITSSKCDDMDNCASSPCGNEGTCLDGQDNFKCTCKKAYTGDRCDVNIDDCVGHSCQNGATCIDGEESYTCRCSFEFTGEFCEELIVDGGWTAWGIWGPCSVTCGSGHQVRVRECSEPKPENGGANCSVNATDLQPCTTPDACVYECDKDPPNPEGGSINCSWVIGTVRQCHPFCDHGYAFDSDLFLDNILCGPDTGYTWNIRSEENPEAKIGTCTEIKLAEGNTMKYAGTYEDLTPDVAASSHTDVQAVIRATVLTQLDALQCVQNGSCSVSSLKVTHAATTSRQIRSNNAHVGFLVELSCTPSKGGAMISLKRPTTTLQRRVNETRFSIMVDQTLYDIGPNGTQVEGEVDCPPGTVEMDYFCVQCGPGSYTVDYYCERCPRGTYKEDFTSPECTPCPSGWTTDGLQSIHPSMCNVLTTTSAENVNKLDGNTSESKTITIVISAVVSAVAVIGVAVAVLCYKHTRYEVNQNNRGLRKKTFGASMNMVNPNVSTSIETFNIMPRKAEQAKTRYIRDDLFVCSSPPPFVEFPKEIR